MKRLKQLLLLSAMAFSMVSMTACMEQGPQGEQGIQGEKGDKGDTGATGADGATPSIGSNGDWWINGVDTGIKATGADGTDGSDGQTPFIGTNGNWWIGTTDTGVAATGPKGDKGDTGDTGATGETGAQGEKGDKGDTGETGAAGADGQDGLTPFIGVNGNWWIGTTDTGIEATGLKGDTGAAGKDGADGEDGEDGLTPTIGYNGNWWIGTTDTGIAAAGAKGDKGDTGATGENGKDGATPAVGSNGDWWINGVDTGIKAIGVDGEDGLTPFIGDNGNWWIGTTDTGIAAKGDKGDTGEQGIQGEKGDKGDTGDTGATGKSAYEIYKEKYGYTGTEDEWIEDLCNGNLKDDEIYTVTFYNEGVVVDTQYIYKGYNASKPTNPSKDGYVFDGWYDENGDYWVFNGYTINKNIDLYAQWSYEHSVVTFDGQGGTASFDEATYVYGDDITLPTCQRDGYTFDGWYYNDTLIQNGTWLYNTNITLKARWTALSYTITLSCTDGTYSGDATWTVSSGSTFTLPVATSNEGKPFSGWYYGDTQITDASGVSIGTYTFGANVTLTAEFFTPIYTVTDFQNINNDLDGDYRLMNDLDFEDETLTQIGTNADPFTGTFDGREHTLKNYYLEDFTNVTVDSTVYCTAGLFGFADGATFKNVSFDNFYYSLTSPLTTTDLEEVGLLAARAANTEMTNIHASNSTINVTSATSYTRLGGLAGYWYGAMNDCSASMDVILNTSVTTSYVGGLVGQAPDTFTANNVASSSKVQATHGYIGGLFGCTTTGTIEKGYSTGKVLATTGSSSFAGGLVGYTQQIIVKRSYNTGSVKGYYTGGLIGDVLTSANIERSYNSGTLFNTYNNTTAGAVGYTEVTSSKSYPTITITNCYNSYASYYGFVYGKTYTSGQYIYSACTTINTSYAKSKKSAFTNYGIAVDGNYTRYNGSSVSYSLGLADVSDTTTLTEEYFTETLGWSTQFWDFSDTSAGYVLPTLKGLN